MDSHEISKTNIESAISDSSEDAFGDDWVHELIAMTRPGVEINFPFRALNDRPVPFEFDDFN
jgi:hypothetical protein